MLFWGNVLIFSKRTVWVKLDLGINEQNIHNADLFLSVNVVQSYLTLCDPMGCSLPGSPVHVILQARMLECVAVPFSRVSSQPRI